MELDGIDTSWSEWQEKARTIKDDLEEEAEKIGLKMEDALNWVIRRGGVRAIAKGMR